MRIVSSVKRAPVRPWQLVFGACCMTPALTAAQTRITARIARPSARASAAAASLLLPACTIAVPLESLSAAATAKALLMIGGGLSLHFDLAIHHGSTLTATP